MKVSDADLLGGHIVQDFEVERLGILDHRFGILDGHIHGVIIDHLTIQKIRHLGRVLLAGELDLGTLTELVLYI